MNTKEDMSGISSSDVSALQEKFGKNILVPVKKQSFFKKVIHIICEPMFLLLIIAATIYFLLGEPRDGAIMLIFVIGIISIDVIQEWKTDKTLNALKDLSAPHITVIRDSKEVTIKSSELVPGDLMLIYEGTKIPADGKIIKCNDLCVDESSLTGESDNVWKSIEDTSESSNSYWHKNYCYAGTLVTQGSATVKVEKIGTSTEYGKIGKNISLAPNEKTPLQKQTANLVKICSIIAIILFVFVGVFTYFDIESGGFTDKLVESILAGITIAMAMIPEEFPVVLTVFLSMGAWRLAKKHSLVRKLPSVETLGSISVLCVDKTGTITMNQMSVQDTWSLEKNDLELCRIMGLGCETDAYDPMEKAMLNHCSEIGIDTSKLFSGKLVKEYTFTNELKMMGHIWQEDSKIFLAAKGSPEKILTICNLNERDLKLIKDKMMQMSSDGLRVIAVAYQEFENEKDIPNSLSDCSAKFLGLIGLEDPPRDSIKNDIAICNKAGIRVVMITGDNGTTASAIAKKVGIPHSGNIITGEMLDSMSDEELREKVKHTSIFSRVIPEHKMRIVKAFKQNGEIVAMTGDGVNDAPALKYADIGISMGKRGSEVSREASDLILLDDNFTTIVETVKDGRRIYDNIRKAVCYIFTIHIPIALSALLAPIIGIPTELLFLLPIHVVLLELLIDPTCSIVLERQPAESDIMESTARKPKDKLLTPLILLKSIIQGIIIFIASFGSYLYILKGNPMAAPFARSMGIVILMLSNILLVQVNSSEHDFWYTSMKYLIKDKVMWIINLATIAIIALILYTPLNTFLKIAPLSFSQLITAVAISVISVFWFEIIKLIKKWKIKK